MTKLLEQAVEEEPVVPLTSAEAESFAESLGQASRGEFATDEQVQAVWAKHQL
jgi:hypothetical protein